MSGALAVLFICGLLLVLPSIAKSSSTSAQTIRTATVAQGEVKSTVSATGQLSSSSTKDVSFSTSGTVKSVKVAVGDTVSKGDVLGVLDATDLTAAVVSAQASLTSARQSETAQALSVTSARQNVTSARNTLKQAKATLKKAKAGTAKGTTTTQATAAVASARSQLTSAKSNVASARSQYTTAQASVTSAVTAVSDAQTNLQNATLKAPSSGTVTTVNVSKGDTVSGSSSSSSTSSSTDTTSGSSATSGSSGGSSSGESSSSNSTSTSSDSTSSGSSSTTAFVITKTRSLELDASFAEADIANIKVGQKASITFPAVDNVTATGTITSISTDATTSDSVVTYAGVIKLTNVPSKVRLGQTADATVTTNDVKNVLYVPSQALTSTDSGYTVKVLGANNTQTTTKVTIGVQGDSTVQIKSGLTAGQKVVISTDTAVASASANSGTSGQFGGGSGGFGSGGSGGRSGGGMGGPGGN